MTQLESDVFTNIDTSGYNPTATSAGGEIGLLGHAVLGYDPTNTYVIQAQLATSPTVTYVDDGKSWIATGIGGDWSTFAIDDVCTIHWDFETNDPADAVWSNVVPTSGETAWDVALKAVWEFTAAWAESTNPEHSYYWKTDRKGRILTITNNNFPLFVSTYCNISAVTWADQVADATDVDNGTASYDTSNSLIRALELIFYANGNAVVRVAVLDADDDSDAESTPDTGINLALTELLKYDGISFINVAGKIPLATIQSHVALASSDTYMTERIYVAGLDLANVFLTDGTVDIPDGLSDMATVNENGRTIVFTGNTLYTFKNTGDITERNIGGNWLAHYVTGFLSSLPSNVPVLRRGWQFSTLTDWDGNTGFLMSPPTRKTLASAFINYIRIQNEIKFYEIGRTFSSDTCPFMKITTRRIIDEVAKNIRLNLQSYLGRPITQFVLDSAEAKITTILQRFSKRGKISDEFEVTVSTTPEDAIDGRIACTVRISPANYIAYIDLTIVPI